MSCAQLCTFELISRYGILNYVFFIVDEYQNRWNVIFFMSFKILRSRVYELERVRVPILNEILINPLWNNRIAIQLTDFLLIWIFKSALTACFAASNWKHQHQPSGHQPYSNLRDTGWMCRANFWMLGIKYKLELQKVCSWRKRKHKTKFTECRSG